MICRSWTQPDLINLSTEIYSFIGKKDPSWTMLAIYLSYAEFIYSSCVDWEELMIIVHASSLDAAAACSSRHWCLGRQERQLCRQGNGGASRWVGPSWPERGVACSWLCSSCSQGSPRVHLTGENRSGLIGYRSNRSGPVPVWASTKPLQIQNLNLNSKKMKNSLKIPKNTSSCDESNGVKISQKFVHLL
jgi:hypothetical protein